MSPNMLVYNNYCWWYNYLYIYYYYDYDYYIIIIIIIEKAKAVHMANTPKIIGTAYAVPMAVKGLIS
jgi:hypothetical protein